VHCGLQKGPIAQVKEILFPQLFHNNFTFREKYLTPQGYYSIKKAAQCYAALSKNLTGTAY
jgi:hypothetical protein